MKGISIPRILAVFIGLCLSTAITGPGHAQPTETLHYYCSNQIYEALDAQKIKAFTEETGIDVTVRRGASIWAVMQLFHYYDDTRNLASSARSMDRPHLQSGLQQIPFCRDPLVIITRKGCGVDSLSAKQVEEIFSGIITNWKEVGGKDLKITVVVPYEKTAANKNFRRFFMKTQDIDYDIKVWDSTMASMTVNYFPCGAISFIGQGSVAKEPNIKAVKIDGISPQDPQYPYHQIFYYLTKGQAQGKAKAFIDFTFSETGQKLLKENGLIPLEK